MSGFSIFLTCPAILDLWSQWLLSIRFCAIFDYSGARTHDDDGGDGVGQHGGHNRNMAAVLQIIGWQGHAALVLCFFFDIGHPCYDQLTPVKTRYLLTKCHETISWAQVTYFLKLTDDQVLVFDWTAGSCHVNLLKTGQDCSGASLR